MNDINRIWLLMGKELAGSITREERIEFDQLLERDPEIWYSYELLTALISKDEVPAAFIRELNSLLDGEPNTHELSALVNAHSQMANADPVPRKIKSPYLMFAGIMTIILVLTSIAFIFWKTDDQRQMLSKEMNEIVAPKGSKTQIILADGTEIWLNAGSKLVYPKNFSMDNRQVFLDGEAYFKVVHDDEHAFVVHTSDADIVDLGTTFNVKAYKGSKTTETTLIEGSIEVVLKKNPSQKILVEPNEKFILHNHNHAGTKVSGSEVPAPVFEVTKIVPYSATNDIIETAWINDKLIFRNETFEELAKAMERRFNVNIRIESEEVRKYELTGIFKNENIADALEVLRIIAPFNYTIDDEEIRITE